MSIDSVSASKLEKTSSHAFAEIDELIQQAIDKASEAKNAGSNRTRGYASLIVLAAGLLFQSGGILALGQLGKPSSPTRPVTIQEAMPTRLSVAEQKLVRTNLERIRLNSKAILETKDRIAPSMPINSRIAAIDAAVEDLELVVLPASNQTKE